MATGNPDPVEVWAPIFLRYWKKEQILDPKFAITYGHCKLCDDTVASSAATEHMRGHKTELTKYLARRKRDAEKAKQTGLRTYQQEQKMLAKAEADLIVREELGDV